MRAVIEAAGFTDVQFSSRRWQSFADAPFESSAAAFGTEGVAILAIKPLEAPTAEGVSQQVDGLERGGVLKWRR
jgi:hypothetical protein